MADKTELNLARIRACDEEIWRTIRGAKVLIDAGSGEIKGGMNGKLNGQKFKPSFGRSLKTGKKVLLPSIHTKFSHHKGSKAELLQRLKKSVEPPKTKTKEEVGKAFADIENFNLWNASSLEDLDEKKKELDKKMAEFPAIYAQLDKSTLVKDPDKNFDAAYFDLSKPDPVQSLQDAVEAKYQNAKKYFLNKQATAKAKEAWAKVVKYKTAMNAAKTKDGKIKNQQKLADAYEAYKAAVAESPYGKVNFKPKTSSVEDLLKKTPQDFMLEALQKKLAQTENNLKKGLTNQNSNANMSTTQALNQLASAAKPAPYVPQAGHYPNQGLEGLTKTPISTNPKRTHTEMLGKCQQVWKKLSESQRDALYEYSDGEFDPINTALRGVKKGKPVSSASAFVQKEIKDIETAIEKSSYDHDIQVRRLTGIRGAADFLNVDSDWLKTASEADLQKKLIGTWPTELGFCSTGVAAGKGLAGSVKMHILCPAGTKMMYMEPFSEFGHGTKSSSWDGKGDPLNGKDPGPEQEALLQRGTQFVVLGVRKIGGSIHLDMQVVYQEPVK